MTKRLRGSVRFQAHVLALLMPALAILPSTSFSNPEGAKVKFGDIRIDHDGDTLNILQNTDRSIIEWDSFSIGANQKTVFSMPGFSSASLNRVTGSAASDIQGALRANGQLWLLNPNGILFGPGSVVDVGGLMASTLNVSDEDFLNGGSFNLAGSSNASVVNAGRITVADGGEVYLAAQTIENHGQILGGVDSRVVLIGANEALVKPGRNGHVIVSGERYGGASIVNTGEIEAGHVQFEAMSVFASAIRNPGAIRANRAFQENGRVILRATGGGGIENSGLVQAGNELKSGEITIDTTGLFSNLGSLSVAGAQAGRISITGGEVMLEPGSLLDARGDEDGGTVTISSAQGLQVDGEINASGAIGRGGNVNLSAGEIAIGSMGLVDVSGESGGVAAMNGMGRVRIDGTITASGREGTGGVVAANAGDAMTIAGSIRAESLSGTGGQVRLTAADLSTEGSSAIAVDGAIGGTARLDANANARIEGSISAAGSQGEGGLIGVTGNSVFLEPTAVLAANGQTDGGRIYLGGGFQGNDARFRESIYTSVSPGAHIEAKGVTGDGGSVVAWSNGATDFQGIIDVSGNIDGGLAEVSGVQSLSFTGSVNSIGATGRTGTLLLDPTNVTIGSTGIGAAALEAALGSNNVVIHTAGAAGELGIITVQDGLDLRYTSANSLSLFAHSDINVGGIVKNHGSGHINLFAGWDGTGASAFTPDGTLGAQTYDAGGAITAADIQSGVFGAWGSNDQGNVTFNPNLNSVVNVGSAGGETNVFGNVVLLNTGNSDGEFTQIGYRPEDTANGATIAGAYAIDVTGVSPTGDINVHANRNLIMLSNSNGRYTQIGHGGENNYDRMTGGDSWQIEVADVDLTGNIGVDVGGALILSAGSGDGGYSMIGHGGFADDGVTSGVAGWDNRDFRRIDASGRGNIDVATSFLQMQSAGSRSQVQIGHGGYAVHGEHVGHINVLSQFGISASAGGAGVTNSNFDDSYVMIGHGGGGVRTAGSSIAALTTAERGAEHQYTLPRDFDGTSGIQAGLDNILGTDDDFGEAILTVDIANQLIASNGAGSPWAVGQGSGRDAATGTFNSALLPEAGLSATTGDYRKVGFAGNITVSAPQGSISFNAGGTRAHAQIGHGGYYTAGEFGGWDIDNADGDNDWATGTDGDITVSAQGSIVFDRVIRGQNSNETLQFGGNTEAYVQIGHGGVISAGGGHGDIEVTAGNGTIEFYGGRSNSYAQIGHGGRSEIDGPDSGFGSNRRSHHDESAQGTHAGNISVLAGSDIIFRSGFGHGSLPYSQIGHGGYRNFALSDEGFNGNIVVDSGGNIDFFAGPKAGELRPGQYQDENNSNDAYTKIGHGGRESRGDHWGSIDITAAGDFTIEATGGYTAIGYGDNPATSNPNPPNLFNENGDTAITGQLGTGDESGIPGYSTGQNSSLTGERNFAMIGHGGYDSEHTMNTSGDLAVQSGSTSVGMGVLGLLEGHVSDGAILAEGDPNRVESNISITTGGNFQLIAPQLAHRGVQSSLFLSYDADGDGTSDTPFVDPVTGLALPDAVSSMRDGFALIGHGGRSSEIRNGILAGGLAAGQYGDISLAAGGQIDLIGSDFYREIEGGIIGSPNTWVTGDSTGNAEYYDLPFWLDGQDGTIDGMDTSQRVGGGSYTHTPLGDLSLIFPFYDHEYAIEQMELDAQDGVLTVGRFEYSRTSGNDMIFGTADDGDPSFSNRNASLDPAQGFAQIGHGGLDSTEGAMQGDITVTSTGGGLNLNSGRSTRSFTHIGHGGDDGSIDRTQPVEGHITVDVDGDINVTGGDRIYSWAMIGHGGNSFNSSTSYFLVRNADVSVTSQSGDINLSGGDFFARDVNSTSQILNNSAQFGKIGHGGWDIDMDVEADVTVLARQGSISMTGTKARGNYTQIGHGGHFLDGGPAAGASYVGNVKVDAYGGISLKGGDAPTYADLAAQNHDLEGDPIFPQNFYPDQEFAANISGTGGQYAFAQIGHGGHVLGGVVSSVLRGASISGHIDVNTEIMDRDPLADITLQAGDGDGSYVLIGHGGARNEGSESFTGNITVNAPNNLTLEGGARLFNGASTGAAYNVENFAAIGHAIQPDNVTLTSRNGNTSGDIAVTALGDILLRAGGGASAYARIGNGAGFNYTLKNTNPGFVGQIGDHLGNISVVSGGDLTMHGATAFEFDGNTQNQFGLFDPFLGNLLPGGLMSAAQIGHGGPGVGSNAGGHAGLIDVRVGGELDLASGQTRNGYAKIGHGDYMYSNPSLSGTGFRSGQITLAVGENAQVTGGQIGHVDENLSNAITIDAESFVAVGRNIDSSDGYLSIEALDANPAQGFASQVQSSFGSGFTGELRLYMLSRAQNLIDTGTLFNNLAYQYPAVPPLRADEVEASEFGFDYVDGLPQGSFTPNGAYSPALGRYTIYYGPLLGGSLPPVIVPPIGGGGSGGDPIVDGGIEEPILPETPLVPDPGLPPVLIPEGTNEDLAVLDAFLTGSVAAETSLLLDPNYQRSTVSFTELNKTASQFTVTSQMGVRGLAGTGSLNTGSITIYPLDRVQRLVPPVPSTEEERREVRDTGTESAPSSGPSEVPTLPEPPQEAEAQPEAEAEVEAAPEATPDEFSF